MKANREPRRAPGLHITTSPLVALLVAAMLTAAMVMVPGSPAQATDCPPQITASEGETAGPAPASYPTVLTLGDNVDPTDSPFNFGVGQIPSVAPVTNDDPFNGGEWLYIPPGTTYSFCLDSAGYVDTLTIHWHDQWDAVVFTQTWMVDFVDGVWVLVDTWGVPPGQGGNNTWNWGDDGEIADPPEQGEPMTFDEALADFVHNPVTDALDWQLSNNQLWFPASLCLEGIDLRAAYELVLLLDGGPAADSTQQIFIDMLWQAYTQARDLLIAAQEQIDLVLTHPVITDPNTPAFDDAVATLGHSYSLEFLVSWFDEEAALPVNLNTGGSFTAGHQAAALVLDYLREACAAHEAGLLATELLTLFPDEDDGLLASSIHYQALAACTGASQDDVQFDQLDAAEQAAFVAAVAGETDWPAPLDESQAAALTAAVADWLGYNANPHGTADALLGGTDPSWIMSLEAAAVSPPEDDTPPTGADEAFQWLLEKCAPALLEHFGDLAIESNAETRESMDQAHVDLNDLLFCGVRPYGEVIGGGVKGDEGDDIGRPVVHDASTTLSSVDLIERSLVDDTRESTLAEDSTLRLSATNDSLTASFTVDDSDPRSTTVNDSESLTTVGARVCELEDLARVDFLEPDGIVNDHTGEQTLMPAFSWYADGEVDHPLTYNDTTLVVEITNRALFDAYWNDPLDAEDVLGILRQGVGPGGFVDILLIDGRFIERPSAERLLRSVRTSLLSDECDCEENQAVLPDLDQGYFWHDGVFPPLYSTLFLDPAGIMLGDRITNDTPESGDADFRYLSWSTQRDLAQMARPGEDALIGYHFNDPKNLRLVIDIPQNGVNLSEPGASLTDGFAELFPVQQTTTYPALRTEIANVMHRAEQDYWMAVRVTTMFLTELTGINSYYMFLGIDDVEWAGGAFDAALFRDQYVAAMDWAEVHEDGAGQVYADYLEDLRVELDASSNDLHGTPFEGIEVHVVFEIPGPPEEPDPGSETNRTVHKWFPNEQWLDQDDYRDWVTRHPGHLWW